MWWIEKVHSNNFCVEVEALAHVADHDGHIIHQKGKIVLLLDNSSEVKSLSYPFPKLANAADFFLFIIDNCDAWCHLCKVQDILHLVASAEPDEVTIRVTQEDLNKRRISLSNLRHIHCKDISVKLFCNCLLFNLRAYLIQFAPRLGSICRRHVFPWLDAELL